MYASQHKTTSLGFRVKETESEFVLTLVLALGCVQVCDTALEVVMNLNIAISL